MVVAIDVGGTKLSTAVIDDEGQIHASRKLAVARNSFRTTVGQIVSEASEVVADSKASWDGITAVGVIVPGIVHGDDGAAYAHNLWGHSDVPLGIELRPHFPVPVRIESDRTGYVLGEQWQGVARGLTDVVFLAIGTGIGAGILSGGRLIRGTGGVAGAVGWFALNPEFRDAYSKVGCWEAEAAGPAVARMGQVSSAERVFQAAGQGNESARRALDHVSRYISMGVANLISVLNPQMVVLGGGLMQSGELLLDRIRGGMRQWAQPCAAAQVRIELTSLGERAGLLGAARIALQNEAGFD